jgi:hypothetical protein
LPLLIILLRRLGRRVRIDADRQSPDVASCNRLRDERGARVHADFDGALDAVTDDEAGEDSRLQRMAPVVPDRRKDPGDRSFDRSRQRERVPEAIRIPPIGSSPPRCPVKLLCAPAQREFHDDRLQKLESLHPRHLPRAASRIIVTPPGV